MPMNSGVSPSRLIPAARTNCADGLIAEENGFHPRDHAWFQLEEAIDSLSRVLTALSHLLAKGETKRGFMDFRWSLS